MSERKRDSELLLERLKREGFIAQDGDVRFTRLYPGHWQRSAGAWVWSVSGLRDDGSFFEVGSCWRVGDCLRASELCWGSNGSIEIGG